MYWPPAAEQHTYAIQLFSAGYGQLVNQTDRRMHSIEFIVRLTQYALICDMHQLITKQFIHSRTLYTVN